MASLRPTGILARNGFLARIGSVALIVTLLGASEMWGQDPAPTTPRARRAAPQRQAPRFPGEPRSGTRAPRRPLPEARERWETLPEKEKGRLRQEAQRLRDMDPRQVEELRRRAAAFQEMLGRALARLSDEERAAIAALSPEKRRLKEQGLVHSLLQEERLPSPELMPEGVRRRWTELSMEEKRREGHLARERGRSRDEELFLRELVRKKTIDPGEMEAIRTLPRAARDRRLLELRRHEDEIFLDNLVERGRLDPRERGRIHRHPPALRGREIDALRKDDFVRLNRSLLGSLPEEKRAELLRVPAPAFFPESKRLWIEENQDWWKSRPDKSRERLARMPAPRFFQEIRRERRERDGNDH